MLDMDAVPVLEEYGGEVYDRNKVVCLVYSREQQWQMLDNVIGCGSDGCSGWRLSVRGPVHI